jgi:hypothetical protein
MPRGAVFGADGQGRACAPGLRIQGFPSPPTTQALAGNLAALERRVKALEAARPDTGDNNSVVGQPRAYQRTPTSARSALAIGFTSCPHGVTTDPSSSEVCAVCASPWNGGYKCDGCNREDVSGPRYACTVCNDFDICQSCNDANEHSHHAMTQIKHNYQQYGNSHPDAGHRTRSVHHQLGYPTTGAMVTQATARAASRPLRGNLQPGLLGVNQQYGAAALGQFQ